jgi:hypothetical protein
VNQVSSKLFASFKYIYLVVFFALLAGFFHPLITNTNFDVVISGVLILFVGLAGGILLYRAAISESKKIMLLFGGFTLILISLFYIFQFTGRI